MKSKQFLLIDEIGKADIEFPNDLLLELNKMEFYYYQLQKTIKAILQDKILLENFSFFEDRVIQL